MSMQGHELPRRLRVADVMTTTVATVRPTATFKEMVRLMVERRVSCVPVVGDAGEVLGIVTEGDLIVKEEGERLEGVPWWRPADRSAAHAKAAGTTAAELMSSPAITVGMREHLAVAARAMQRHRVKHLPVVDGARLVGVVSRCDLLSVYARDDADIRTDVVDGVVRRWLFLDPERIEVIVEEGRVHLSGELERRSDVEMVVRLVRGLDGVVAVENDLGYRYDDGHSSAPVEARVR